MGKFLYLYRKRKFAWQDAASQVSYCLARRTDQPYCFSSDNELLWISDPTGLQVEGFSLLTGSLYAGPISAQTFFSFKLEVSAAEIKLSSDTTASRSVWYYVDEEQVIVSSSQRAIITLMRGVIFNQQAVSWMMTTGSLGPGNSWDKRIRHLTPLTKATIDKNFFRVETHRGKLEQVGSELDTIFRSVFTDINTELNWGITLSGGYDSRIVLLNLIKAGVHPLAFTWGLKASAEKPGSDAEVALKVAQHLHVQHEFIDLADDGSVDVLHNFVLHGEGRIDHVNSFSDGLRFWEHIKARSVDVVVRADEAFGWLNVKTEQDVRISLDLNLPRDYKNLSELISAGDIESPIWPGEFERAGSESIGEWRDRLYRNYRIPYILSALHDPMLSFVEIANPLLYTPFVSWAAQQSDSERTGKTKFKLYADKVSPPIPLATTPSIPEPEKIIQNRAYYAEVYDVLDSADARSLFGSRFVSRLLEGYKPVTHAALKSSVMTKVKAKLPFGIKKLLRRTITPYVLDHNRLVLRAYIVMKMKHILAGDLKATEK